jgi:hypothetical protein
MQHNERDGQNERRPDRERGVGNEDHIRGGDTLDSEPDLQREGTLVNERNRNRPGRDDGGIGDNDRMSER